MLERFGVGRCCCQPPDVPRLTCEIAHDVFGDYNDPWQESHLNPEVWDIASDSTDWEIIDYWTLDWGNRGVRGSGSVYFNEAHQFNEPCQHIAGAITILDESKPAGFMIQGGNVSVSVHAEHCAGWWPKLMYDREYYVQRIIVTLTTPDDEISMYWYSLGATTTVELCLSFDCEKQLARVYASDRYGRTTIYQPDGYVFYQYELQAPFAGSAAYTGGMFSTSMDGAVIHSVAFNRARHELDPECPICAHFCSCTSYAEDNATPGTLMLTSTGWFAGTLANGQPMPPCSQIYGYDIGECVERNGVEYCLRCHLPPTGEWEGWNADIGQYEPIYTCADPNLYGDVSKECLWTWNYADLYITEPCAVPYARVGWRVRLFDALDHFCTLGNFDNEYPYWNHRRIPIVAGHYYVVIDRDTSLADPGQGVWAKDLGTDKPRPFRWGNGEAPMEVTTYLTHVWDNGTEECKDAPGRYCVRQCFGGYTPVPVPDEDLDVLTFYLSAGGCGGFDT